MLLSLTTKQVQIKLKIWLVTSSNSSAISQMVVSISDLEAFFKERGNEPFPPSLLKELGKEPADHLDHFTDAFVFYYLAVTKRPCCDVCQAFLKGLYFTCLDCFENEDKTYNLCNNCFCEVKDCPKGHGHVAFLDNFAAFQAKSKATENLVIYRCFICFYLQF